MKLETVSTVGFAFTLFISACAPAPIAEVGPTPQRFIGIVEKPSDVVWRDTMRILSMDLNMPLKVSDQSSGIVQTDAKEVEAPPQSMTETLQTIGGPLGGRYRYDFTILIQSLEASKTEITVASRQQILSSTGGLSAPRWVDRRSDGAKERDLLKRLGANPKSP